MFVVSANGEPLQVGKPVPKVEGKTHGGETVRLHEVGADGWMLVYFYPKASTGG